MRPLAWAALLLVAGCAHAVHLSDPASCVVRDDLLQLHHCFDFVGLEAKEYAPQTCPQMEGHPEYERAASCTDEGRVGSCATNPGTEQEVVERCYVDADACEKRCRRHAGAFTAR